MKRYVGIDLGTTNSAICTFDGREVTVWKSPEMSDVTPSVIYIDKRGNRFYGHRAYDLAPMNEKNAASLFKRYLGTNMKFTLQGQEMTPEECSAEILKVLYGYLPPEIAADPETATVITVPAAFNQMKKDATLEAAHLAGINRVTLIQEPVAAVMSVMKASPGNKKFIIYDLGGGTFDISVTESIGKRVNLLAQGGREMCGGRDLDRQIFRQIAKPWIEEHFKLPADWAQNPDWKVLSRLALYACEQAKIELASISKTEIRLDEMRINRKDLDDEEIYLDIPISQEDINRLLEETVQETVDVTRQTLKKIGLAETDIDQIIFVGGPTKYAPLRQRIIDELGIPAGLMVDQMTAVAQGASIYAESVDWGDVQHHRKQARDEISALKDLIIRYEKRTSADSAKIAFVTEEAVNYSLEVTSSETGWTSGRVSMTQNTLVSVPLTSSGDNHFQIRVWDSAGRQMEIETSNIVITRTMAVIGTVPASSSIAVKVLDRIGGKAVPLYLIKENDPLPKKGQVTLVAGQTLHAGSEDALIFTLWEGDIPDPIEDNRYIGTYRINGKTLPEGTIRAGAEIICEYEMSDAGALRLGVSIPSIGANLQKMNYYSRQEGQTSLDDCPRLLAQISDLEERIAQIRGRLPASGELAELSEKVADLRYTIEQSDDPESLLKANNDLLECLKKLSIIRRTNRREIRLLDLDMVTEDFQRIQSSASESERAAFNKAREAALRAVDKDNGAFEVNLEELRKRVAVLLWQDDEVIRFNVEYRIRHPENYTDRAKFDQLRAAGLTALSSGNVDEMRRVLARLVSIQKSEGMNDAEMMMEQVNVVRK